jgi:hypothetical protein
VGLGAVWEGLTGCLPALTQRGGRIPNFTTQHPLSRLWGNFLKRLHSIREFLGTANGRLPDTNLFGYSPRCRVRARKRAQFEPVSFLCWSMGLFFDCLVESTNNDRPLLVREIAPAKLVAVNPYQHLYALQCTPKPHTSSTLRPHFGNISATFHLHLRPQPPFRAHFASLTARKRKENARFWALTLKNLRRVGVVATRRCGEGEV